VSALRHSSRIGLEAIRTREIKFVNKQKTTKVFQDEQRDRQRAVGGGDPEKIVSICLPPE
jgi:hypothetical protein